MLSKIIFGDAFEEAIKNLKEECEDRAISCFEGALDGGDGIFELPMDD